MNFELWIAASVVAVFVCLVAAFPNLCIGALNLVRSRGAREPYVYGPTPWLVILSFTGGFASMFVAFIALSSNSGVPESEGTFRCRHSVPIGATASTTAQAQAVYK